MSDNEQNLRCVIADLMAECTALRADRGALLALLVGCVEHMEHSTPQGAAAWRAARAEIDEADHRTPLEHT